MEPYRPRETNMRVAAIHFPLPLWRSIQKAAKREGLSASAWVRKTCAEKLAGQP